MSYEHLLKVSKEIEKCVKCASCQAGCPTYEQTRSETLAARGKIRLAEGALTGELGLTGRVENDFFQCLSCMNCKTVCPSGVDTMKIFSAMRAEVYREKGAGRVADFIFKHLLPHPRRLSLLARLTGVGGLFYKLAPGALAKFLPYSPGGVKRVTPNFLKRNLRARLKETLPPLSPPAEGAIKRVAYFSGCMTDLAFPETGTAVVEKLREAGLEVVFPGGQVCCGAPAYYSGDVETAKKLVMKNAEALVAAKADAIVYSCATCGSVVGEVYRELFPEDPRVLNVAEKMVDFQKLLLALKVKASAPSRNGGGKLKVTYHDPCHLKRGMGVFREPRELIASLPGVEFVEMEGADRCCGGAGTFAMKHYDMAMEIGRFKAGAVRASGADVVVTACPSCQSQLADALNRFGVDRPVLHTAELISYTLAARLEREERRESAASSASSASAARTKG